MTIIAPRLLCIPLELQMDFPASVPEYIKTQGSLLTLKDTWKSGKICNASVRS